MGTTAFMARRRADHRCQGQVNHVAQFQRLDPCGIKDVGVILDAGMLEPCLDVLDLGHALVQHTLFPEHAAIVLHIALQFLAQPVDGFTATAPVPARQPFQRLVDTGFIKQAVITVLA